MSLKIVRKNKQLREELKKIKARVRLMDRELEEHRGKIGAIVQYIDSIRDDDDPDEISDTIYFILYPQED